MKHLIELHLHLDGSLRAETVWELAKEQGKENYEVVMVFIDSNGCIYVDPTYDYEFDDEEKKMRLL